MEAQEEKEKLRFAQGKIKMDENRVFKPPKGPEKLINAKQTEQPPHAISNDRKVSTIQASKKTNNNTITTTKQSSSRSVSQAFDFKATSEQRD